ncbi:CoA transferase [Corynebacterium sp. zg254]|uniref:CoA transferase n=1 Tax=Corynebacterium zhongnanshanii TaxID=2768834 RepID=A0ABQ6VCU0_9CORY|nr:MULTISPECIES: CoA transferase [Corynebacterium]KAB3519928.1 CoA transferase [Corynebacterium zhongnanshanii]MCR5914876.1 CoA transferase [Corynebacterium sp. zg254]
MGALDGVVIADFSRVLAGPYATMMLADMGAEVIKIERPGTGDDTRAWGPPFNADGVSTYFAAVNRNKKTVQLDLHTEEGLQKATEIAAKADILVENFRPGTMERLGLGYEELSAINPGLIYASLSGFGSNAGADIGGYDLVVQAVGGLMSVTGESPDKPVKVGVALVDVLTGLHLGIGILAALHHRHASGEGQRIEINLLQAALSSLANQSSAFVGAGVVGTAMGNKHPSIAPYEVFRTRDGDLAVAAGNDSLFQRFCHVIERPDLPEDERFQTNTSRVAHRDSLAAIITDALSSRDAQEWFRLLRDAGVPAGPVNSIDQAFEFATDLGLNPITTIDGSPSVSNPLTFSKTPVEYRSKPRTLEG